MNESVGDSMSERVTFFCTFTTESVFFFFYNYVEAAYKYKLSIKEKKGGDTIVAKWSRNKPIIFVYT